MNQNRGVGMRLESARDLKEELIATELLPLLEASRDFIASARLARLSPSAVASNARGGVGIVAPRRAGMALSAGPVDRLDDGQRSVAIGLAPKREAADGFAIAVRVQRRALLTDSTVQRIVAKARGEVDVRYVGRIQKRASNRRAAGPALPTAMSRPLAVGCSVGHYNVTAGTLGAFVVDATQRALLLSNNHVLVDEDRCAHGDAILQPGVLDGGRAHDDQVAKLERWIPLAPDANYVDAAVASVLPSMEYDHDRLRVSPRKWLAIGDVVPAKEGLRVLKRGRTTLLTRGRISAFEVDNVVVAYDRGNLLFNGQLEIDSTTSVPFRDGGDSGSLIVDHGGGAVGLLFAGSDSGGRKGMGLAFANPIEDVLRRLDVSLLR